MNQLITINGLQQKLIVDRKPSNVSVLSRINQSLIVRSNVGLPLTVTNLSPTICQIDNQIISILKVGDCRIQVSQTGNRTYSQILPTVFTFFISKENQVISAAYKNGAVVQRSQFDKAFPQGVPVNEVARSNSGLQIDRATASGACLIENMRIRFVGKGNCTLFFYQNGNDIYEKANLSVANIKVT
jgi:hypothetical protein